MLDAILFFLAFLANAFLITLLLVKFNKYVSKRRGRWLWYDWLVFLLFVYLYFFDLYLICIYL